MKQLTLTFQEYELKIIREALTVYRDKFNGAWKQGENGQCGYEPTPGTRRINFITRSIARQAEKQGVILPMPWPKL